VPYRALMNVEGYAPGQQINEDDYSAGQLAAMVTNELIETFDPNNPQPEKSNSAAILSVQPPTEEQIAAADRQAPNTLQQAVNTPAPTPAPPADKADEAPKP
jgi:hypothetical protein